VDVEPVEYQRVALLLRRVFGPGGDEQAAGVWFTPVVWRRTTYTLDELNNVREPSQQAINVRRCVGVSGVFGRRRFQPRSLT
jgi:hypothetical protein